MRYTETKIYDVKRSGTVDVGNVARNALKKANRRLVDGVQPFEMNQAQQFSMGYLSGFLAENRDMELSLIHIYGQHDIPVVLLRVGVDVLHRQRVAGRQVRLQSRHIVRLHIKVHGIVIPGVIVIERCV